MPSDQSVALVVTYNRKELLRECLQALQAQSAGCDIVVIDNASTDGTEQMVRELSKTIPLRYVNTGKNLGGAGGFNRALKEGMKGGWTYFWLMDDDCIAQPDALEQLLKQAQDQPDFGFLSSKVIWTDGSLCRMNEQKLLEGSLDGDAAAKCRQASFVSFFTQRRTVQELGLPITDFFIWGDDVEYSRRISAKKPSWYVPASTVVHKTKNNAGSNIAADDAGRLDRYRYAYRNEVYIARQEGWKRALYQGAKILYHSARVLLQAPDHKKERLSVIWSSSKEGLSFQPEVEKSV